MEEGGGGAGGGLGYRSIEIRIYEGLDRHFDRYLVGVVVTVIDAADVGIGNYDVWEEL